MIPPEEEDRIVSMLKNGLVSKICGSIPVQVMRQGYDRGQLPQL
jgi:hypothetical protein